MSHVAQRWEKAKLQSRRTGNAGLLASLAGSAVAESGEQIGRAKQDAARGLIT